MDKEIEQLHNLTEALLGRLEEADYEELSRFVESRQDIVESILKLPLTPDEKKVYFHKVQLLLQADPIIQNRMQTLKNEATKELRKTEAARKHRSAYTQEFATYEGAFFDRKK